VPSIFFSRENFFLLDGSCSSWMRTSHRSSIPSSLSRASFPKDALLRVFPRSLFLSVAPFLIGVSFFFSVRTPPAICPTFSELSFSSFFIPQFGRGPLALPLGEPPFLCSGYSSLFPFSRSGPTRFFSFSSGNAPPDPAKERPQCFPLYMKTSFLSSLVRTFSFSNEKTIRLFYAKEKATF